MSLALRRLAAFLLSATAGAFCSVSLIVLSWGEPVTGETLSFYGVALFWGTLLSLPYVIVGLALFGLPVTWWLHRHARKLWFGVFAAGWGAVAGSATYNWFNRGRSGEDELGWLAGIEHLGAVYGVTTGLAWWLIYRRLLTVPPNVH